MLWLDESWGSWLLVAGGGAIGSALGVFVLRHPSPKRLLAVTAIACGVLGAMLQAYPHASALTALLGFGVLGSASSMVSVALSPHAWLGGSLFVPSVWVVVKRLAIYGVLAVTFAMVGYIAVSAGHTVDVKTR